jgi:hypothetical protein
MVNCFAVVTERNCKIYWLKDSRMKDQREIMKKYKAMDIFNTKHIVLRS